MYMNADDVCVRMGRCGINVKLLVLGRLLSCIVSFDNDNTKFEFEAK